MDTRQLAAFCAVVERRSFSQAADRLGVTQPAVSLQIRSLEERLGRRLLDRSGRRVEPTEAGVVLFKKGARLLPPRQQHPSLAVSLSISDTDRVIEQVAERELELGIVGALRRHRSLEFEPLAHDQIVLAVPPGHPFAGKEMPLDRLPGE